MPSNNSVLDQFESKDPLSGRRGTASLSSSSSLYTPSSAFNHQPERGHALISSPPRTGRTLKDAVSIFLQSPTAFLAPPSLLLNSQLSTFNQLMGRWYLATTSTPSALIEPMFQWSQPCRRCQRVEYCLEIGRHDFCQHPVVQMCALTQNKRTPWRWPIRVHGLDLLDTLERKMFLSFCSIIFFKAKGLSLA
jgi:hypothetical protein